MARRLAPRRVWLLTFFALLAAVSRPSGPRTWAGPPTFLHAEGSQIVDSNGRRVILTGINWFGLETPTFAPHGLWARNWQSILDQIRDLGFNTIRLPYSNQLFEPASLPTGIDYDLNPDLRGLAGVELMDRLVAGAGARGLKIILDRHRPDSRAQSQLWYTSDYPEEVWIADWVMLARRYAGNDTVIGVDLHNEPHGLASWGSGQLETDWRLAAERAGNAILEVNPDLLILVQGIDEYQGDWYWWGGNLMGARQHPVRLSRPSQLVYSSHLYGPGVYPQPWFWDPSFPDNLPAIWDRHWGYLSHEGIAPVIVGEFGGRSTGDDREGIWQRNLVSYLRRHGLSYFYWTFNPNSEDTGGILLDDWTTVDSAKLALLSGFQFPLLGIEELPDPAARPASSPSDSVDTPVRLMYRNANLDPLANESKPEFILVNAGAARLDLAQVELFYWFRDDGHEGYVFHCDWAAIGCGYLRAEFGERPGGWRYLRLSFSTELAALRRGQDTGEIKVRFHRSDWTEFSQMDDHSFGSVGDFVDWAKVTVHVDGIRVWGEEPEDIPLESSPATQGRQMGSLPGDTGQPPSPGLGPAEQGSQDGHTASPGTVAYAGPPVPAGYVPEAIEITGILLTAATVLGLVGFLSLRERRRG